MGGEEEMHVQLSKIGFLFTGITHLLDITAHLDL
jgi:hypothetical protein